MFDYATLIRLLEIGVSPKSDNRLFVCENEIVKRRFLKRHKKLRTDFICTINDVWKTNYLIGRRYKQYELVK